MTRPARISDTPLPSVGADDLSPPPVSTLLHGVVLRPPALLWDGRRYTGPALHTCDIAAARHVPGVVDVVVLNNFIGIIASQARQATHGRAQIHAQWRQGASTAMPLRSPTGPPEKAATNQPAVNHGSNRVAHNYSWPVDTTTAAAWAIAHYSPRGLHLWTACAHPTALRDEIALLCKLQADTVFVVSNGQTSTDGYDVAVDAALLTMHCGLPVRVHEENSTPVPTSSLELRISATGNALHTYEAAPANNASSVRPAEDTDPAASLAFTLSGNLHASRRPSVAALLCGYEGQPQAAAISIAHDYYPQGAHHLVAPASAPIGPHTGGAELTGRIFACESFFDELALAQNLDPLELRLNLVENTAGRSLIQAVADKADWGKTPKNGKGTGSGQGFAYAHVVDNTQDPPRQVWSAWVAEVAVDPQTGVIDLTRLTVGHNAENLHENTTTERLQEHVRDTASQLLRGPKGFDDWGTDGPDSITGYALVPPKVELVAQGGALNARPGWNRHAELPAAAAIANAIHDATGVRFRQPPFDPASLKTPLATMSTSYKKWTYALLGGVAATIAGLVVSALPWRTAIPPLASVDTSIYSQAAINRGKLVAAAGDCVVCHTVQGGQVNVGGRPLDTPFGTVYTTNITPDPKTGIGAWSYAAFERAMRQGVHRDGRKLYPAFPYTAFAKITDADMQALYAYLMTQDPVEAPPPQTRLAFPFNLRPLMAGWNLLFHRNEVYTPDPGQNTLWNRGAYLVQGVGHCTACHSPRNALGAEKSGKTDFLGGGFADGWEAPALNTLSKAPIAWTEDALYDYLRTGYSSLHGVAAGPMAPVVQSLGELPDSDVRAIAHYLSSLAPPTGGAEAPAMQAARLEDDSRNNQMALTHPGENLFEGACAVCHDARGGPPLFGSRPSLALNSNLHSDSPDNVIQVLLHGIEDPATANLGNMPGFGDSMNDQQLDTLINYLRLRFAPDKPAWENLAEKIARLRPKHQ